MFANKQTTQDSSYDLTNRIWSFSYISSTSHHIRPYAIWGAIQSKNGTFKEIGEVCEFYDHLLYKNIGFFEVLWTVFHVHVNQTIFMILCVILHESMQELGNLESTFERINQHVPPLEEIQSTIFNLMW